MNGGSGSVSASSAWRWLGKYLGVIGLGRVGALVARKAQGLGITTLGYDPYVSRERAQSMGVELLELSELLPRVDFITVHTPKTRGTTHLIGRDEFALMKRGVRVVQLRPRRHYRRSRTL